jgi:hypothetical protein
MFELMAKYKVPGIANGESRASSVILFGDGKEQSEAGGMKRDIKGKYKTGSVSGAKSVATSKSFGNALRGTPGTIFNKEGIQFTVLGTKDQGGHMMVRC